MKWGFTAHLKLFKLYVNIYIWYLIDFQISIFCIIFPIILSYPQLFQDFYRHFRDILFPFYFQFQQTFGLSQYKRLNRKYKSNSLLNLLSKAQIRFSARTVLGKNF